VAVRSGRDDLLDRAKGEVSEGLPKLRKDDFAIELLFFLRCAIAREEEETGAPPKIVHVRLAAGK